MRCISSARFNMSATILVQGGLVTDSTEDDGTKVGHYENKQDPETGEIVRVWVPKDYDSVTPGVQSRKIKCIARGILDGGIRVAGTTERYTPQGLLDSVDFIKIQLPPNETITKRDRVTNVSNRHGVVVWREEESDNAPTVFDVLGVTPVVDPFGQLVEWSVLLQRSEAQ